MRITPTKKPNALELMLEGRLEGPWVDVLRKSWIEALRQPERPQVLVDLGSVSFADSNGRALLLNMQEEGVGLIKPSAFLREMLKLNGSAGRREASRGKGE
jgi:ABC-type transporter Mla MlaB component